MYNISSPSSGNLIILHLLLSFVSIAICLHYILEYDRLFRIGNLFSCYFVWIPFGTEIIRHLLNKCLFQLDPTPKGLTKTKPSKVLKTLMSSIQIIVLLISSTILFSFFALTFGAPVMDKHEQTLALSVMLSGLTVLPLALYLKPYPTIQYLLTSNLELYTKADTAFLRFIQNNAIGAVLGAWSGSIVAPLDWDREWQAYPIPNICGALIGFTMTNVYSLACLFYEHFSKRNTKAKKI